MRRLVPFALLALALCVFVAPSRDRREAATRRAAFGEDVVDHLDGLDDGLVLDFVAPVLVEPEPPPAPLFERVLASRRGRAVQPSLGRAPPA